MTRCGLLMRYIKRANIMKISFGSIKRKILKEGMKFKWKRGFRLKHHVDGSYFVTTDIGILFIQGNLGRLLTSTAGYGLYVHGDSVYTSFDCVKSWTKSNSGTSYVVKLDKESLIEGSYFGRLRKKKKVALYKQSFRSSNGRIHEIHYDSHLNRLLICATDKNSIDEVKPDGRIFRRSPFLDKEGKPVVWDREHLNTVLSFGDDIFFVAYKVGGRSMIGLLSGGEVFGWFADSQGFHNLVPTGRGFLTCDTFGQRENGRVLDQDGFFSMSSMAGVAPRGIVHSNLETLIGHSHKGPRSKRFHGFGALVRVENGGRSSYIPLPASQVYSIAGIWPDNTSEPTPSSEELKSYLRRRFGEQKYIGTGSEGWLR